MKSLQEIDPEIKDVIRGELQRQSYTLEMIASENFTSRAVLEAMGSVLTNKYAEGYPHKRYYGGCEFVDRAEELAQERAQQLFKCAWANVQTPFRVAGQHGRLYGSAPTRRCGHGHEPVPRRPLDARLTRQLFRAVVQDRSLRCRRRPAALISIRCALWPKSISRA